jgi:hypothetical protein
VTADFTRVWLSPTSAARLLACPASLGRTAAETAAVSMPAPNAGTLAHLAVQRWIEHGDWRTADAAKLTALFDGAANESGVDPVTVRDGRLTRARLAARASQLAELLGRSSEATIMCETELRDPSQLLHGILDIAVLGEPSSIIDLKTGRDAAGTLTSSIQLQLQVYAHLFRAAHGALPDHIEVFSLSHGPRTVEVNAASVQDVLDAIAAARLQKPESAYPAPESCRFCRRRMTCEPHWARLIDWETSDALEGDIVQITHAETGTCGMLLATVVGPAWIVQLPAELVPDGAVPGRRLRAVRVSKRQEHDNARDATTWRASALTAVAVVEPL